MSDTVKEPTARKFATKAIHEDKLNLKNPSVLAELLREYADLQRKPSETPTDDELRKEFFEKHCSITPRSDEHKVVVSKPNDLFEWMRDNLTASKWISYAKEQLEIHRKLMNNDKEDSQFKQGKHRGAFFAYKSILDGFTPRANHLTNK